MRAEKRSEFCRSISLAEHLVRIGFASNIREFRYALLILSAFFASVCIAGCDGKRDQGAEGIQSETSNVSQLTAKASAGDAAAALALGALLEKGVEGKSPDPFEALKWYEKAAKAGSATAMGELAKKYRDGIGVRADYSAFVSWVKKGATLGDPEAIVLAAEASLHSEEFVDVIEQKNEEGYLKGVSEELAKLTKVAESGNAHAQFFLGNVLRSGREYEIGKLANFFDQFDSDEYLKRHSLQRMTARKFSIVSNPELALRWMTSAAASGFPGATIRLAWWYQVGSDGLPPDVQKAATVWEKVSTATTADEQHEIGMMYFPIHKSGLGARQWIDVPWRGERLTYERSAEVSEEWLTKAASQGNVKSALQLARLYESRDFGKFDPLKAFQYRLQAAEAGDADAERSVAGSYYSGIGTPKSLDNYFKWEMRAARNLTASLREAATAQSSVAYSLAKGEGVEKDEVLSYAWANVAAAAGNSDAKKLLDYFDKQFDSKQVREAQQISSAWKPGEEMKRLSHAGNDSATNADAKAASDAVPKLAMSGSGFLIDSTGTLVTNFHIGGKCKEIKVPALSSKGTLLAGDAANDLAVLKIEGAPKTAVRLSIPSKIRQGQDIVVFGFPLEGYLPSAGNITTGLVTSLFGSNNNTSLIQISAPIQQGNSGGPVLDDKGDVVGVVSSKADAIRIAKATGDIIQNVNFAISLGTLQAFLDANRIDYQKPSFLAFSKKPDELASAAREYTFKVECWR